MNDQERQIIADIFRRLEGTASQTRDPDAERFIADKLRTQPYAPYAMAQSLYVQEEALKSLNAQIEELRQENEHLRQKGGSGGGIFSSIFGGGSQPSRDQQPAFGRGPQGQAPGYGQQPGYAPQQGGPWGGGGAAPQQGGPWAGRQQAAPAGGGFLRGALTTAAGVAGGMVVGSALMNAFSGSSHSTLGSLSNTDMSSLGFGGDAGVQNASFSDGGSAFSDAGFGGGGGSDATLQDASFDDGGSDFGGGSDDSSWS